MLDSTPFPGLCQGLKPLVFPHLAVHFTLPRLFVMIKPLMIRRIHMAKGNGSLKNIVYQKTLDGIIQGEYKANQIINESELDVYKRQVDLPAAVQA